MTDSDLAVAGVRYERLVPMERWRLGCDAEAIVIDLRAERPPRPARVVVDLEFRALTPAIGSDGQGRSGTGASAETRQHVGKGHLEQAGRWSGWIEAGGVRYELARARGNRDKSWGPRRWGGPRMWRWFSINVGDDVHLGGIRIATEAAIFTAGGSGAAAPARASGRGGGGRSSNPTGPPPRRTTAAPPTPTAAGPRPGATACAP